MCLSSVRYYTKKSCEYECRLQQSFDKCGCVPWNFPHDHDIDLCDGVNAFCFENQMSLNVSECTCLPNCREMRFDIETTAYPINAAKECNSNEGKFKASCRQISNNTTIVIEDDINVMVAERLRYSRVRINGPCLIGSPAFLGQFCMVPIFTCEQQVLKSSAAYFF